MAETQVNVTLPAYTAFGQTEVYQTRDGEVFFGLMRESVIADATDQIYTVTESGKRRLDLLSELFYGTTKLWWVICQVNNIVDPMQELEVNVELRVPTRDRLAELGILAS